MDDEIKGAIIGLAVGTLFGFGIGWPGVGYKQAVHAAVCGACPGNSQVHLISTDKGPRLECLCATGPVEAK
jgi:hypothetical protein